MMRIRQALKIAKRVGWHSSRWSKRGGRNGGIWLWVPRRRAKSYRLQTIQRAWQLLTPNVAVTVRWER